MTANDTLLLNQTIEDAELRAPEDLRNSSRVFDYFATGQVLKDFDLSDDEIVTGLTDGNGDGGVDAFYVFADENLVDEDFDYSHLPRGYNLDVYLFQNKRESGFTTTTFDKLIVSLPALLNLSEEISPAIYSKELITRINIFRNLFEKTARKFPAVKVHVVYATHGSVAEIDYKVTALSDDLKHLVEHLLGPGSKAEVDFWGARELLESARREPSETLELPFRTNTSIPGQNSYVALVSIQAYADFLTEKTGKLKKVIFESNVRDFQGNTTVNKAIRDTLSSGDASSEYDFWWLNNGITILSSQITITGGKFVIKDPQIVNGLQTSVSIHNHFKNAPEGTQDDRLALVKLIESNNEDVRNSVIVATNSQTNLLPTAIRAADDLQRDIEQFFVASGYYYDRRKNLYKNQGKPAELIFTVPYLAQSMMSIGFSQPDQARARPSTLINKDVEYQRIYDKRVPMRAYLWIVKLQREVDRRIKLLDVDQEFRTNMRFHLAMLVGAHLAGEYVYNPVQLMDAYDTEPNLDEFVPTLAEQLEAGLGAFMRENPEFSIDRAAKSSEFVKYLIANGIGIAA